MKNNVMADIVFPAFGAEYLGCERDFVQQETTGIEFYLQRAEKAVDIDKQFIEADKGAEVYDELQSQFASYIYSCIFADIINQRGIKSGLVAAYSMGLYAALYHCGVFSFEDGLRIIRDACQLAQATAKGKKFAMGVIVGLDVDDVKGLISAHATGVDIININNQYQIIICGPENEVVKIITAAQDEGALKAYILQIKNPYHTAHVKSARHEFEKVLETYSLQNSKYPLVSSLDQKIYNTRKEIINEMVKNIYNSSNWYKTMEVLIEKGSKKIIECGPGKSLCNMARFIPGDYKIYHMKLVYNNNFNLK
ncbi:MAG: ACP S-malonyltransferase [Spirochaetales bacterium]|nr:ACP S-malonyltransferase [Spirochaetales bacterium]